MDTIPISDINIAIVVQRVLPNAGPCGQLLIGEDFHGGVELGKNRAGSFSGALVAINPVQKTMGVWNLTMIHSDRHGYGWSCDSMDQLPDVPFLLTDWLDATVGFSSEIQLNGGSDLRQTIAKCGNSAIYPAVGEGWFGFLKLETYRRFCLLRRGRFYLTAFGGVPVGGTLLKRWVGKETVPLGTIGIYADEKK
jgi:hypothetical protein